MEPQQFCLWHSLLLCFARINLLPNHSFIGDPCLQGLPKGLFGKLRGQPAHDGLEAFRASGFGLSLELFLGFELRCLRSSESVVALVTERQLQKSVTQ